MGVLISSCLRWKLLWRSGANSSVICWWRGGGGEPLHLTPPLLALPDWIVSISQFYELDVRNWIWVDKHILVKYLPGECNQSTFYFNSTGTNLAWSCGHLEAKHISYLDCLMFSFPFRTYCTCNNYLTGLFATLTWLPWDISLHCDPTFHPLEEQVTKSSPIYPLLSIQIDTQQFATFFSAIPINPFTVHSR